ncbi:MAG: TetR/AcrR family transcriptional regulator [Prevotella sp.]|nr:TetR/AcrR family transcriptional regulator [Prevotella sp.]
MQESRDTTAYKSALRGKIMETAIRAFIEHGIRAVKMDDISKKLSVSKRTVYEIFNDKEDLIYECVKYHDQEKQQYLADYAREHHVIDIVMEAYRLKARETHKINPTFYQDIMRYPKVEQYIRKERERGRNDLRKFMQRGVEEGFFRADINYDIIVHLIDAMESHLMNSQLLHQYRLEELFVNFFLVALRGVCTEQGAKAIDLEIAKI